MRTPGLLRDGSPSAIALWLPLVLDGPLAYAEVSSRLVEQQGRAARARAERRTRVRAAPSVSLGEGAPTRVGGAH